MHALTGRSDQRGTGGRPVVIRVSDDGPGIPAGGDEALFQPFWRGAARATGTGLGLAIARGFAEANGGAPVGRAAREAGRDARARPPARRRRASPA